MRVRLHELSHGWRVIQPNTKLNLPRSYFENADPLAKIYAQTPTVRTDITAADSFGNVLADYRTQIATAQGARASFVTLLDGMAILSSGDLADGVHPPAAGEIKYANYVRAALGW
jgi:hypothetical protein